MADETTRQRLHQQEDEVVMPKFFTALLETTDEANRAVEALKEARFKGSDIQTIDQERSAQGFFDRLFLDENGDGKSSDISVMGIARGDVDAYIDRVRQGAALVIVMYEEEREPQVKKILERFARIDLAADKQRDARSEAKKDGQVSSRDRMPETGRGKPVAEGQPPKWFRVVDIEEPDLGDGARSHSVHVRPTPNMRRVSSSELPGAHRKPTFEQFEEEFRLHYAENFADSGYDFDDYRLGYLYGMSLAQNEGLADRDWESIEVHAGRGWRDHTTKPWKEFGEAVRFGWRIIKREQRGRRRQQSRP